MLRCHGRVFLLPDPMIPGLVADKSWAPDIDRSAHCTRTRSPMVLGRTLHSHYQGLRTAPDRTRTFGVLLLAGTEGPRNGELVRSATK